MPAFVDIQGVTHVYARAEDGAPAVENLNIKVGVLRQVEEITGAQTILATNTS